MKGQLNIALRAALEAGRIMMDTIQHTSPITIENKDVNDFVTNVDKKVERAVVHTLMKAFPDHRIISEENYAEFGDELPDEPTWIIDPIDGTCNFIHGIPMFAVSIALMVNKKIVVGVIHNPYMDETYTAIRGQGAQLNERRIRVSKFTDPHMMMIGGCYPSSFPYRMPFKKAAAEQFCEKRLAGQRILGSAALSLAYVASGRLDGYYHTGQKIWDVAAGSLLVTEAGGMVSDFSGRDQYLMNREVVAGSPAAFKMIAGVIKDAVTVE